MISYGFDLIITAIKTANKLKKMILLPISWEKVAKDSRVQGFKCLFAKDFISAFNIISISAMSFLIL